MGKTSCKKGQYYCNTDKKCKPIPDGYKVREDGFLVSEGSNPRIPRKAGQPAKSKKHSDLYTDEDPKGTIHGLGFKDVATAKASVAKIRKSSRSHAHKIQAAIAMEQRARVMGKTAEAAIYRKFINSMKKKTKKMNEAVSPAQQAAIAINMKKEGKKPKTMKEGSLHKWFKGSKSKDGKGGWVNVVTGGTCASDEPGEGTPKCVSSAKRASMSKKERLSAARRKKKADPNQQSKSGAAKPTYVSTDKPKKKKKMKEEFISLPLQLEVPQNDGEFRLGLMFRESLEKDRGMLFVFENTDRHSFHMKNTFIPLDIAFINEEGVIESIKELDPMSSIPVYPDGKIRYAVEVNRGWFAENGVVVGDTLLEDTEEAEIDLTEVKDKKGKGSGTKDACYHKVKSRYSVWPSAYASGALVKCRKVGAANWGNSRKEEVEYEAKVYKTPHHRWRDEIVEHHKKDADGNTIPHEDEEIKENKSNWRQELDEKCWKGYEKKGMKTMFGKRYPNCVKKTKKEELEVETSSLDEKLVHGNFGNYIKGQKLPKNTEKKYKEPPYKDLAASVDLGDDVVSEKALSKKQQRFMGAVLNAKRTGEASTPEVAKAAVSMKTKDVKDFASTKHKGLPEKKKVEENTAIESELVIQDWNVDDIKFTEIETVDIIKAKPLKEKASIDEGFKKKIVKKVAKQIIKQFTKKKPKVTKSMIDSGVTKYKPVDKITSQNIQTKSIINQTKKANQLANKPNKGTTPVKVNLQKKIDFDKYIGGSSTPIKKKFVEKRPTGTFTDDLPPAKTEPLTQTQKNKIKKIQKNIDKNKKNKKEDKPNLMSSYDWRTELGEDWQKVNRKDKTDGLSKKAVKAYRRENPGSKLKTAVTKDPKKLKKGSKDAKRRLSFCRRMKGMKKRLTSAKTARDPDSRINKALRRWNCWWKLLNNFKRSQILFIPQNNLLSLVNLIIQRILHSSLIIL